MTERANPIDIIKESCVATELRARTSRYSHRQPATVKLEFDNPEAAAIFFAAVSVLIERTKR